MVKTIKNTMFECSICKKVYDNKVNAEECERNCKRKQKFEDIEDSEEFTITKNHLKLLREMNVEWNDCEFGAPCIDPKRPYGNSNVIKDIAEVIGIKKDKTTIDYDKEEAREYVVEEDYFDEAEWNDKIYNKLSVLHREMQIVLQIVLFTGKFEEGDYVKKDKYDYSSWIKKEQVKEEVEDEMSKM